MRGRGIAAPGAEQHAADATHEAGSKPSDAGNDYTRYGTTSLFAASVVATGRIIGALNRRHRSVEFRKFLDRIEEAVPEDLDVHLILDKYGTHKTTLIRAWLAKRTRLHANFTPTDPSWMTSWSASLS